VHRWLIRFLLGYGAAAVVIGGCAPSTPPEARVGLLLEEADILAAVFRSAQAPIATDPFCAGIAAPDMHSVGRFVAGLLAAHERDRANWVQIWTREPSGLDPGRDVSSAGSASAMVSTGAFDIDSFREAIGWSIRRASAALRDGTNRARSSIRSLV
jgi:hypothetical protein